MLLIRQVARPDGALLCAVELLPDVPCAFPGGSCFPMVLCAFPAGSCLSMVSPAPAENLHASAPAERQPLPHRLPLRSIPPAALRLRALPIHEDMGVHGLCGRVTDSARNACSLNCCCSDRRKSVGPPAPIAYATSVSPPDEAAAWPGTQVLGVR